MRGLLKKIFTLYSIPGFLLAAALPLIAGAAYFRAGLFILLSAVFWRHPALAFAMAFLAFVALPLVAGWLFAVKAPLPRTLFARLMPLVLPPLILPLAIILYALAGSPIFLDSSDLSLALFFVCIPCCCLYLAFLIRSERRAHSAAKLRGAACLLGIILASAVLAAKAQHFAIGDTVMPPDNEASVEHDMDAWRENSFLQYTWLPHPASPPSLRITSEHPRLDGSADIRPLYAAFASAVYAGSKISIWVADPSGNTGDALARLTKGKADIFFGLALSQEERDKAVAEGLTLTQTPIGLEALVFFTHKDNPVRTLTREQIRAVYSGRIRNWKELGGRDELILAFQRPIDSDTQAAMLRVMDGKSLIRPLYARITYEHTTYTRIGIAAYRNRENAIGYSLRWYATALSADPDIRLLAIDGVLPTPENIRSGAYPFAMPVVAVTAKPLSPQDKSLLDWILGPEGQTLLARVGSMPLHDGPASAVMSDYQFMEICGHGAAQQVLDALKNGASLKAGNTYEWTPLMTAAQKNPDPQVIAALVKAGADVSAKDGYGSTPLIQAAEHNPNPEVAAALVRAGADVNVPADALGWTPLLGAAMENRLNTVTVLINAGADVNARNKKGSTPLFIAGMKGLNPEVITALVKAGADVNAQNKNGETPLLDAAGQGHSPEGIAALIKAGADVNARDKDGWTPLLFAAWANPNPETPEIITTLVKAGADVNANRQGMTALMFAAKRNDDGPEAITTLLKLGADPKAKDNSGKMAIDYARSNKNLSWGAAFKELEEASR